MTYRGAWKCNRCPQSNGRDGCPAWVEYAETNGLTNEVRATKECLFQALPKFLTHTIAAANRPAAAAESFRNELATGLAALAGVQRQGFEALLHAQRHLSLEQVRRPALAADDAHKGDVIEGEFADD